MIPEENQRSASGTAIVPATESQLEVWMSCLIGGEDASRAYNFSVSLTLTGDLDRSSLEKALQFLIDRHESLRAILSSDGSDVVISDANPLNLFFEDLAESADSQQIRDNFVRNDINTPLDLNNGPLYKVSLIRMSPDVHVLIFTAHHLIVDGWSMNLLMEELGQVYSAYRKGLDPDLPPAVSFSNYAAEQQNFVKSPEYEAIQSYWVNQFSDQVPVLEIPTDYPRPAVKTTKSKRTDFNFGPDVVEDITRLSNQLRCGLAITLRAVFEILLYRLTGQDDIVLGLPVAGQPASGNDRLVSHCVNLLPLRSKLNEELTFKAYANERKLATLDAYDNQQFTFGSLLKKLSIARDTSRVPLVSAVFGLDLGISENVHFDDLEYNLVTNKREYENFEIFVNVTNEGAPLTVQWTYNTQLFAAENIAGMMRNFESLIKMIVKDPERKIRDIILYESAELYRKLEQWNDTAATYPRNSSVSQLIEQKTTTYPNKIALSFRERRITYKQLDNDVNQLAWHLIDSGIVKGDKIALAIDRTPEMVVSLLAIMKSGAVYIPVDPAYPLTRIEYMLADSSAKMLITSAQYAGKFKFGDIQEIILDHISDELRTKPVESPPHITKSDDLVYIMYTSGSTGTPKGIAIEHKGLMNFLCSMRKTPGIDTDDKLLAVTTISFDISGLELYLPLISGAELLLADANQAADGRELVDLVKREQVTIMQATPSTWRMMLEFSRDERFNMKALCGGEALPKDLAATLTQRTRELWNMYGPTETTIWSTVKRFRNPDDTITVGRPINNTAIYILDEDLQPVPQGSVGEICIAGDGLAKGYLNKPELTSSSFTTSIFLTGQRIYKTGDLGKFTADGEIICLGRKDTQLKVRGYRIEAGAVENALNTFPNIQQSVVISREDNPGDQRLVAYVIPEEIIDSTAPDNSTGFSVSADVIEHWKSGLKQLLPVYMIPGNYVILKKFPHLPNGKVDRKALPRPAENYNTQKVQGPHKTERHAGVETTEATDLEKLVSRVWSEFLNIEKIGLDENFFELGGHSMIAVRVMGKIEKETGQRLPLASLFEYSTIRGIASLLKSGPSAIRWDSLVPIKPLGNKMPLYIVHGAGLNVLPFDTLAKHMNIEQPVYGLQAKGLNGIDDPLEKIEDMAAYYIEEILAQNPTGPYALAGFSFGGLIAFDMAKQLKTMGKEVKVLAIFDTNVSQSRRYDPLIKRLFARSRFFANQVLYSFKLLKADPIRTIQYKSQSIKRIFVSLYWKYRYGDDNDKQGFYGYSHAVDMKNIQAVDRYVLTPYNGVIDLFRAKKRLFFINDFVYLGWKQYAMKGIRIHDIPGEHNYIFDHPNVEEFAVILQKCLDNATKK